MTQAWQQCLHNNPHWLPKDASPAERRRRLKLYIMPNDPDLLLNRVANNFPNAPRCRKTGCRDLPRIMPSAGLIDQKDSDPVESLIHSTLCRMGSIPRTRVTFMNIHCC